MDYTVEDDLWDILSEGATLEDCLRTFLSYGWEEEINFDDLSKPKERTLFVKRDDILVGLLILSIDTSKPVAFTLDYQWRFLNLEGEMRHFRKIDKGETYTFEEIKSS